MAHLTENAPFPDIIELNDLPRWSPWPARLLSLSAWTAIPRTTQKTEQEYDREKYAACMEYLHGHTSASPEELKWFELGQDGEAPICVSCGERLFRTTLKKAWQYYSDAILSLLSPLVADADIVCDLGCGYGYHLWLLKQRFPGKQYWGGEFSPNAVSIAGRFFKDDPRITVERLDLTDPGFAVPFMKKEKVLILSVFAMHQLPLCRNTVERLAEIKGDQWDVCHFEPVFDWCSESLLGQLRRAYTIRNDYNRDLLPALTEHPRVHVLQTEKEVIGLNPLHPVSYIHWQ